MGITGMTVSAVFGRPAAAGNFIASWLVATIQDFL
jgi:hypothetical protein